MCRERSKVPDTYSVNLGGTNSTNVDFTGSTANAARIDLTNPATQTDGGVGTNLALAGDQIADTAR